MGSKTDDHAPTPDRSVWQWVGAPPDDRSGDAAFRRRVAALAREVMLAHGADPATLPHATDEVASGRTGRPGDRRGEETEPGPAPDYFDVRRRIPYVVRAVDRAFRPHVGGNRSVAELQVLLAVARSGQITTRELRRWLELPSSTVATVTGRLERAGLMERRRWAGDRRTRLLVVTPAGRVEAERAAAGYRHADRLLLGELTPSERDELHRLLRRALAALGARTGGSGSSAAVDGD